MPGLTLRPETDDDLEFLRRLYAASREREMALVPQWPTEQKDAFLEMQFDAQRRHYREHYPDANFDLIERDGIRLGRFYVARLARENRLMDISLLPDYRNTGIGRALCTTLIDEARKENRLVSLHVEEDNPAKRLYERLGFVVVGDVTFYKLMHWVPRGLAALSDELAASAQATTTS